MTVDPGTYGLDACAAAMDATYAALHGRALPVPMPEREFLGQPLVGSSGWIAVDWPRIREVYLAAVELSEATTADEQDRRVMLLLDRVHQAAGTGLWRGRRAVTS